MLTILSLQPPSSIITILNLQPPKLHHRVLLHECLQPDSRSTTVQYWTHQIFLQIFSFSYLSIYGASTIFPWQVLDSYLTSYIQFMMMYFFSISGIHPFYYLSSSGPSYISDLLLTKSKLLNIVFMSITIQHHCSNTSWYQLPDTWYFCNTELVVISPMLKHTTLLN